MGRPMQGVYDRPCVRAVFLGGEDARTGRPIGGIALVSADLLVIPEELRRRVEGEAKTLSLDGFLLCATHTHSGIGNYWKNFLGELLAAGGYREPVLAFLAARVSEAVKGARAAARPARLGWVGGEAAGLNRHRRDPKGTTDSDLDLLRVEDGEGRIIARAVSFSAHPTVLGPDNLLMSADYPGFLCRALERQGGIALFLNGASAELAPWPPGGRSPQRGSSPSEARRLGEALAEKALELERRIACGSEVEVGSASASFTLPAVDAASVAIFPFSWLVHPLLDWAAPEEALLQVFTVGEARLATFPCDLGVELGRALKKAGPGLVIPVSYADGFLGYAVDKETYRRGWYESKLSFYGPMLGEFLLRSSLSLFPAPKSP